MLLLGWLGIHRFYVCKVHKFCKFRRDIAQIFTLRGLGIWVLVDLIVILAGAFRD